MLWIERTPPEFTFTIKAYSLLTNHPTRAESIYRTSSPAPRGNAGSIDKLPDEVVEEVWQRFRDALMLLHSAGKLGAVLFQFPQWFVISKTSKAYIEESPRGCRTTAWRSSSGTRAGWKSGTRRRRCRS